MAMCWWSWSRRATPPSKDTFCTRRWRLSGTARRSTAAALAPVAVLPAFQNQGIGGELIRAGNARCAALGLEAIVVLGHADYYPRFGFSAQMAESLQAPFSGPHFMALELKPGVLEAGGKVRYAKAFGV
jgi:putative acetyltransferase